MALSKIKTNSIATGNITSPLISSVSNTSISGTIIGTQLGDGIVGQIGFFGFNTAPTGWIKANGAAVSRTTYSALYAVIGTTYGSGDGSTTFNVPDFRGEFLRGWDDARGVDSNRAIGSTQSATVIRELIDIYSGNSTMPVIGMWNTDGSDSVASRAAATSPGPSCTLNNSQYYQVTMSVSGGSGDNSGGKVRPRNFALLACIKY